MDVQLFRTNNQDACGNFRKAAEMKLNWKFIFTRQVFVVTFTNLPLFKDLEDES